MRKALYKSISLAPALLVGAILCHYSYAEEQDVHALRSAYLYYFSNFIQWPKNVDFHDRQLNLCAFTDDAEDRYQLSTIENQNIGKLKLKITIVDANRNDNIFNIDLDSLQDCHLVYFSEHYNRKIITEHRNRLNHAIFVTEDETNDESRIEYIGDIHLFKSENKLNFYIDAGALQSRNFEASSKLLRLSRKIPSDQVPNDD